MPDMNRRSFISTLTALAGVVLAKFKAPAAPDPLHTVTHPYWRAGVTTLALEEPITAVRKTVQPYGDLIVFSKNKAYTYSYSDSYGWREWKHPISERYGRLLTLNEYGTLVDTCPSCGEQSHPGYELICCSHHAAYCTCDACC